MENMDKGLTVPKWVLINWPKIPQIPQNLSAQIVCLTPKVWDFDEKRLHWVSVVLGPSSQSLDSHSLSIEDALHSDYWIGFQWAHTLAPPLPLDGDRAPRADNSIGPDVPENPIIFY